MANGTIIILNGTSSSGKSSILKALQGMLTEPYLDMGLDRFIWMLPKRYLDRPLWDDVLGKATVAGATGHQLVFGMHRAILAASHAGNNIIADHVLVERIWVDDCANIFADRPTYLIGVRCPLEMLEQRERSRKDRTLGQARDQFPVVHRYCVYDLEVDTSVLSPEQCATRIIERIKLPPDALQRLRKPLPRSGSQDDPSQ